MLIQSSNYNKYLMGENGRILIFSKRFRGVLFSFVDINLWLFFRVVFIFFLVWNVVIMIFKLYLLRVPWYIIEWVRSKNYIFDNIVHSGDLIVTFCSHFFRGDARYGKYNLCRMNYSLFMICVLFLTPISLPNLFSLYEVMNF